MERIENNQEILLEKLKQYIHDAEPQFTQKIIDAIVEDMPYEDIIDKWEIDNLRVCSECGKLMDKGYCIENGESYYCSDECLEKGIGWDEYMRLNANGDGDSYYTEWE